MSYQENFLGTQRWVWISQGKQAISVWIIEVCLYISNLKDVGLLVLDKTIFKVFPYESLYKTSDPWAEMFLPQSYNLNSLGPVDEATYQISGFRQRFLKSFASFPHFIAMATRVLCAM